MSQSTVINKALNEHKISQNDYRERFANYTVEQIVALNESAATKHTWYHR